MSKNITKYKKWILLFIVVLAFLLRFYKITEVPPSLNWDEVSIGYNAYSLLNTGKDEWGEFLPMNFLSFGEYKLPGQIYVSIPAIAIIGLNPLGVRITPVIYGVLTVLFLYLLVKEMFKKDEIALISAFFLAVSPWHVQLTRGSFESSFALFWVVLGTWLLVKGLKNPKWWIVSSLPFALAVYTYNSARAFVPLFLVSNLFIFRKEVLNNKKEIILSITLFAILMIPFARSVVEGQSAERFKLVSITEEAGLVPRIEEQRNLSTLPEPITVLIHNRPVYISFYFARNYLAHFTPDYLFINGAGHHQHHVQGIGQLYLIQAPFLIYGLYVMFKKKRKYFWMLVSWMLLAFIPVAFTFDSIPHALRTLNAAPVYQIFTAYGLYYMYMYFKKRSKRSQIIFTTFVIALFMVQFVQYIDNLYNKYPFLYSRDWQYGNKQAVEYIKENYQEYDLIVYTREYGEPHIFTLFYLNYDPDKFQNNSGLERFETYDWVRVLRFDKFYFPDLGDEDTSVEKVIGENEGKKILFVGTPEEIPDSLDVKEEIHFLDGKPAFVIAEKI